jgi:ketosteroid isomerase-like protein
MNKECQKAVIDGYIAAYNAFDVEGMLALIHPRVVFKNITGNEITAKAHGINELRTMADRSKSLFSSSCQQISSFSSVGDTATVAINYEGVLATNLPNGMKSGETLKLIGRSIFQFREGKLYRITDYS